MNTKRVKLPLWRWDPFLLGVLIVASLIGTVFERLAVPVLTPIGLTVVLTIGAAAAVLIVLPLFVRSLRRDGEGTLELGPGISLEEVAASDSDTVLPVVDGKRMQGSIEAAVAHGDAPFTAVLVPRATAWLGRDYRVAVDLLVGGKLYRAGYLPREIDQRVDARLTPLARSAQYVMVPASILNPKKPFTVRVAVGTSLGASDPR
ncbi:hypothetical protein [Subtercola endophyticus]|uniref:hypothetical protein n=1 Tax=Subtercola endophyticus TaxID=2895559 RepID=UPI001E4899F8|nr:hypothetical protein [Subtercola endophyticus]UFS60136.1 hypothetical protein LQ955_05050 [Subtercola endophyticus]